MRTGTALVGLILVWLSLRGHVSLSELVLGALIAAVVLVVSRDLLREERVRVPEQHRTDRTLANLALRMIRFGELAVIFLWELVRSSRLVAVEVFKRQDKLRVAIVAVPMDAHSDAEITLLSILVSLTPGTLVLDVSTDRRTLYVHALLLKSRTPDQIRAAVKHTFGKRVVALLR